jgi:hypothetical protein
MVLSSGPIIRNPRRVPDNVLLTFGVDGDGIIVLNTAGLSANEEVDDVIEGTSAHLGNAANSLIISNTTTDSDIHILVSKGGHSHTAFLADGSTGDTILNAATGQSVDLYVAGTKEYDFSASDADFNSNTLSNVGATGNDWAANALTMSNGASTSNMVLTVHNSTNSGASHSYLDLKVGGTSTTGDPHIRFTTPSGTSWYMGTDTSNGQLFYLGTGTTIASSAIFYIQPQTSIGGSGGDRIVFLNSLGTVSLTSDSASRSFRKITFNGETVNLVESDAVTGLWALFDFQALVITATGSTTVNKATGLKLVAPKEHTNVTLVDSSALRIVNCAGDPTNQHGILIETLTSAATDGGTDYAITIGTTDADHNLIHVGVTGDPIFSWDETNDWFEFNNDVNLSSGDLKKAGTNYNNPDYVFEQWVNGSIKVFKDNDGASDYRPLSLPKMREFITNEMHLPGAHDARGIFARADFALQEVERLYTYIFALEDKLTALEV